MAMTLFETAILILIQKGAESMKKVLKAVKAVGLKTAKNSVNSASFFYMSSG